jgi:hypothetical protein
MDTNTFSMIAGLAPEGSSMQPNLVCLGCHMLHSAWAIIQQDQDVEQACCLIHTEALWPQACRSLDVTSGEGDAARQGKPGLLAMSGPCLALGYVACSCPAQETQRAPSNCAPKVADRCAAQADSADKSAHSCVWPYGCLMPLQILPAPAVTAVTGLQSCSGFVRLSQQLMGSLFVHSCDFPGQ